MARLRGLGAGKKLLAAAMAHVAERDIGNVVRYTMGTRTAVLSLYRAAGFGMRCVEERDLRGHVPETSISSGGGRSFL